MVQAVQTVQIVQAVGSQNAGVMNHAPYEAKSATVIFVPTASRSFGSVAAIPAWKFLAPVNLTFLLARCLECIPAPPAPTRSASGWRSSDSPASLPPAL